VRYGIDVINFADYGEPAVFQRVARAAEAAGWDGLFCWDHLAGAWDDGPPAGDPWVLLAAAACVTVLVRLGTNVTPVPRRRPHVLATQVATLARLSGGRVFLGVGLGGVPDEYERFGEPAGLGIRAELLDEGLDVISALWSGETVTYAGRRHRVTSVRNRLVPVQRPRVPIWVGGGSPPALRRAARWDGWTTPLFADQTGRIGTSPDAIAASVATIQAHRTAATPFDVVVGAYTDPTPAGARMVAEYAAAGATWWLEELNGFRGPLEAMIARVDAGPPA
jgi:alkanesulfonate monooxygenase SsuD/methylene tetrahydromethanopterin reductase-like flavin-dependent oxidoreductase (luciferase family)